VRLLAFLYFETSEQNSFVFLVQSHFYSEFSYGDMRLTDNDRHKYQILKSLDIEWIRIMETCKVLVSARCSMFCYTT